MNSSVGIVGGEQRRTADNAVPAGLKEVEKALPNFVACHESPLCGEANCPQNLV